MHRLAIGLVILVPGVHREIAAQPPPMASVTTIAGIEARLPAVESFEPGGGPEPFAGSYVLVPDHGDDIDKAINEAVDGMNFVTRRVARGRLRRTNRPAARVSIVVDGDEISIQPDDRPPARATGNGPPVEWENGDGEVFEVSIGWEEQVLRQSFIAKDGQRVNAFTLSEDGQILTMQVTVSSPRLPNELTYRLIYEREHH